MTPGVSPWVETSDNRARSRSPGLNIFFITYSVIVLRKTRAGTDRQPRDSSRHRTFAPADEIAQEYTVGSSRGRKNGSPLAAAIVRLKAMGRRRPVS